MALLEVSNLGHRFGGLQAVKGFDLELHEGELVGIIGPNGAGKTTVFNLITGVYRPTEGEVRFRGERLTGLAPSQIVARGIARTFQTIRLFKDLSVLDNVRIAHFHTTGYGLAPAFWRTPAVRAAEERLAAESLALLERFGLQRYAGEPARNLPYGDQRRLEIARAIATGPRLLLLDEPAAGMNPAEVHRLSDLILWIRERFNLTILLIEHQMRMVMRICERIKVLDFGQTIAEGRPGEVRTNPRVLEAYLGKGVEAG